MKLLFVLVHPTTQALAGVQTTTELPMEMEISTPSSQEAILATTTDGLTIGDATLPILEFVLEVATGELPINLTSELVIETMPELVFGHQVVVVMHGLVPPTGAQMEALTVDH